MAARKRRRTQKPSAALIGESLPTLTLVDQFDRIGGELTPQRVSMILREADSGQPKRFVDLFHECRQKDSKVQTGFSIRELAVSSLPIDVVAQEGAGAHAQAHAKWAKKILQSIPGLRKAIAHLAGEGTAFGHATLEIDWRKAGSDIVPAALNTVHCRRFYFDQSNGALLFGDSGFNGVDLQREHPNKFIQYRPRINGDVLAREGLARLMVWLALFRNWDIKDWMKLAELAWKPKREGVYKQPDAKKPDTLILKRMLERWGTDDVAYHPDTVEYKLHWPPGGGSKTSTHHELAQFLGTEILEATIGTADVVQTGPNGSRASTQERGQVRIDIRDNDAAGIGEALTRDLLRPLIEMNRGRADGIELRLVTDDAVDGKAFSETIKNITAGASVRVPAAYVRDRLGIPEPKDDEEVVGGAAEPEDSSDGDGKPKAQGDDAEAEPKDS